MSIDVQLTSTDEVVRVRADTLILAADGYQAARQTGISVQPATVTNLGALVLADRVVNYLGWLNSSPLPGTGPGHPGSV